MRTPFYKKRFHKDIKRLKKRGKTLTTLMSVMRDLIDGKTLHKKYYDHALRGQYSDCRECHIAPDFLLIYMVCGEDIFFMRTGTHSDLF